MHQAGSGGKVGRLIEEVLAKTFDVPCNLLTVGRMKNTNSAAPTVTLTPLMT